MSLRSKRVPRLSKKKLTKKQLMKLRARKGAVTKLQKKRLEMMQTARKVLESGGNVFDVCTTLDCALNNALKIVKDVNTILQRSGETMIGRRKGAEPTPAQKTIDELVQRVTERVKELTGQKKP